MKTILTILVFIALTSSCPLNETEMPLLYQPIDDCLNGNCLIHAYVAQCNDNIYKIVLVYADEDFPSVWNTIYDLVRLLVFRKVQDVEVILYHRDKRTYIFAKSHFCGFHRPSYSESPFYSIKNLHNEKTIKVEGRLRLFVNTWNHGVGLKDANSQLLKARIDTFKLCEEAPCEPSRRWCEEHFKFASK